MHKYQSLEAWRSAHAFVLAVFRSTDAQYHPRARPLFDQLRRASISIEANIVEGYALETAPQFRRHLRIANGSAAESECLVRIIRELSYLDPAIITELERHLGRILATVRGLLRAGRVTKHRPLPLPAPP